MPTVLCIPILWPSLLLRGPPTVQSPTKEVFGTLTLVLTLSLTTLTLTLALTVTRTRTINLTPTLTRARCGLPRTRTRTLDHPDRIDFVFVRGAHVTDAFIVGEDNIRSDVVVPTFPGDHRASLAYVTL
jgi:hypothetical protein